MAIFRVQIQEPVPEKRGFIQYVYALIEVYEIEGEGDTWVWRQIDDQGFEVTPPEKTFHSDDAALDDAIKLFDAVGVDIYAPKPLRKD